MENKTLKQIEARLLTILDDETLGVDRDNIFLAIALVRKLASNEAIENINAAPSDYGEVILDIELKNDCSLVLFLDYKENQATSYVETDQEIKAFLFENAINGINISEPTPEEKAEQEANTKKFSSYSDGLSL